MEEERSEIRRGNERKKGTGNKSNNFSALRLCAACFVFAGHMGMLLGGKTPTFTGFSLHWLGVSMLFLIGGYLVSYSWLMDPHPLRYGIKRFMRLWPPFAVMVLLMTYAAGPLVSDLGVHGYFGSWYKLYLLNLRFYIVYAQPGVFPDNPIPMSTNGSLWTMPVEAALYVLTPFILSLLGMRRKNVPGRPEDRTSEEKHIKRRSLVIHVLFIAALCLGDVLLRIFAGNKQIIFYGTDLVYAYHLIVMYMIGMLFVREELQKTLSLQKAVLFTAVLFLTEYAGEPLHFAALYVVFPYLIFSLALAKEPVFAGVGRRLDLSYGIYLYGYFFQQLVIQRMCRAGHPPGYLTALALSGLLTIPAAVLSWFLIEKPSIAIGKLFRPGSSS